MSIVQDGDPVLRAKAAPVAKEEFGGKELSALLSRMAKALDAEPDGVALAAPQIGVSKRIFIVRYDRMKPTPEEGEPEAAPEVGVYINPDITKRSRRKEEMDEGCLSVRGTYGKIKRNERATVRAQDENGKKFERGAGGILAQAFQHEIDHLDGILFIDGATELTRSEDLPEKPRRAKRWEEPTDA
jgi:peptide deformylase